MNLEKMFAPQRAQKKYECKRMVFAPLSRLRERGVQNMRR